MSLNLTRDELQAVVDRRIGHPVLVPLGDVNESRDCPRDNRTPLDILIAREEAELHIAERVAEYMAVHYEDWRLTLSQLGPAGVHALVSEILGVLPAHDYVAEEVAASLDLNPTTYNRIAGQTGLSDLARATAQLCCQDEHLREFACECGLRKHIRRARDGEGDR